MKLWSIPFIGGALLAACTVGANDTSGGGGSAGSGGSTGTGGDAGNIDATADADESQVPAVEGVYAQMLVYAAINDIPAVGPTPGTTTTIQRVVVQRTDTALAMTAEPCAIEVDNGTPVIKTIIPAAFLASLGASERTGSLVFSAGQWRFVQDTELQLRGVKLDQPETDALPTDASDPRVWDQDQDGKPGVTVRITGLTDGEVYVVQRDIHALDGVVQGDFVDGSTEWSVEQVVLGSDNPILNVQTVSTKNPDAKASRFRSTRISSSTDCAAILAQRDQLFAR